MAAGRREPGRGGGGGGGGGQRGSARAAWPRPRPAPVTFRARAAGAGPGGGDGGAMFVQEEKIFAGKVLRLHVCASDGAEWLEEATEDTSVEKLKERCLKHVRPAAAPGLLLPPPLFPAAPDTLWTRLREPGPRLGALPSPLWFNSDDSPGGGALRERRLGEAKSPPERGL